MYLIKLFFSLKGKINRLEYLGSLITIVFCFAAMLYFAGTFVSLENNPNQNPLVTAFRGMLS